jgi:hypothetical protein
MSDTKPDAVTALQEAAAAHLARLMESQARLAESAVTDLTTAWWLDPRDLGLGDDPRFLLLPAGGQALLNRRSRGEFIPAFVSEPQLSWMRRRTRATVVNNEIALNAVNQRINYAVGTGLRYEVQPKPGKSVPGGVVEDAQAIVDAFTEHNELYLREPEIVARVDIDGECFLRTFERDSGLLSVRFIEPEFVKSPKGDSGQDSFGVRQATRDVESVEGYWVVPDPVYDPVPELVPAAEVLHVKHPETPLTSKRGLSAFYPVETNLRAVEDLVTATVSLAKARAKVAWVHKLAQTTAALASDLTSRQAAASATDPVSGRTINMERYPNGAVLRIPNTSEIEFPSSNIAASDHVAVAAMVIRIVAARFSMPEYLLSSDASNANYSNTMVAESPFVKAMERLQDFLGRHLGGNRYDGPRMSLVWRQLMYAARLGMLPPDIRRLVDVQVEGPSLIVRDVAKEAQVDQIYNAMKVKSKKTIQLQQSLDPDEEAQNFAEEAGTVDSAGTVPTKGVRPPPGEEAQAPAEGGNDGTQLR